MRNHALDGAACACASCLVFVEALKGMLEQEYRDFLDSKRLVDHAAGRVVEAGERRIEYLKARLF